MLVRVRVRVRVSERACVCVHVRVRTGTTSPSPQATPPGIRLRSFPVPAKGASLLQVRIYYGWAHGAQDEVISVLIYI